MFGSTLLALVLGGLVCGVLGLVVVAIVVGLVVSMRRRSQVQARMIEAMSQAQAGAQAPAPAESPQVRDQRIPLRRFGQCAVFIITGDQDYGYFPAAAPQRMLSGSWGIADTAGARAQIEAMLKGPSGAGGVAFDQVRAIHLSRAAAGALFITQDESWEHVAQAARRLQGHYRSWDALGHAYLEGKNRWLSERGLDTNDGTEAKVERLRREVWPTFPIDTLL